MIAGGPPKAPTGSPPPMTLPKHHRSGVTPKRSAAPPRASRKPVITSSNSSRAPAAVAGVPQALEEPGRGRRPGPCWRPPARRTTTADVVAELGHDVVGRDDGVGHRPGGHAGRAGQALVGHAAAAGGQQRSVWPW